MKAVTKLIGGGVAGAALFAAAPAAAQYPGYGYGYPGYGSGGVIGQVINSVIGGGYGPGYGYNPGYGNQQAAVSQCVGAVQQRLSGGYGYNGGYGAYGYNGGYGGYNNGYGYNGGARVLGISRVEQRSGGGLTVRGVANSGRNLGYNGYYNAQSPVDLTFRCKTDYRGFVVDVDVDPAQSNYGQYTPYNYDYSQYGYRRY